MNRILYQMDNLDMMRGLENATIDLIATDPPFNKGRDFHGSTGSSMEEATFTDRWRNAPVPEDWITAVASHAPSARVILDGIGETQPQTRAYLYFIGVRLIEMRRILKPTGSLFLHCDDTANGYLRVLLDLIFGVKNLRNCLLYTSPSPRD